MPEERDTGLPEGYGCVDEGSLKLPRAGVRPTDRASVWTERMTQSLSTREKWFSLYDKVHLPAVLQRAWERVEANDGAAGVDGVSVSGFARDADARLRRLSEQLAKRQYRPSAIRRVEIPKSGGGTRPLGIPTVTDRIVQAAVVEVIEPIFESRFLPCSYGFRPGRSCKDALRAVKEALTEGLCHVVDADLSKYFDSIPHARLLALCHARVVDGAVLGLIEQFLKQPVMAGMAAWTPELGTPQGAVLSPLLANIYLHPLDELLSNAGFRMVRYADDFVVLCRDGSSARQALALIQQWVQAAGLALHPDKTRLSDLSQPQGWFDFLGYRFRRADNGRLIQTIKPKKGKALRAKLAQLTRRTSPLSTEEIVDRANRWLRGVFEYFKHSHHRALAQLDAHVRFRLRRLLSYRSDRTSARSLKAHRQWSNQYFHNLGLFSLANSRIVILRSNLGTA